MPPFEKEKERFFAQLDGLDQSTDSEDDPDQLEARKRRKIESVTKSTDAPTETEHIKARKKCDAREPVGASGPSLRRVATEDQPTPRETDSARRTARSIRRTNSEPDPPSRSRRNNAVKTIGGLFEGLTFFFIPNDDVVKVRKLRIQSAVAQGATWARTLDSAITHIVVDAAIDAASATRTIKDKVDFSQVAIVKDTWLIESMSHRDVRDPSQGRFQLKGASAAFGKAKSSTKEPSKRPSTVSATNADIHEPTEQNSAAANGSEATDELSRIMQEIKTANHLPFDEELDLDKFVSFSRGDEHAEADNESSEVQAAAQAARKTRGFACMEPHTGRLDNPNNRTIDILQQMATYYDRIGDNWRTVAYRKAIAALRKQDILISTRKQALAIFGVGSRLADKIEEIVTTDRLSRLDSVLADPDEEVLQLFMGIHDVGFTQAKLWMRQGYRTLDDLRRNAKLSPNQQVGIDHYDDFQQRIPRAEVEAHGAIVQKVLARVARELQAIIGGSYRRGMADSGDIDIMITHPTADLAQLREWVFHNVIPDLFKLGFLKCALATSRGKTKEQVSPAKQKKSVKITAKIVAMGILPANLAFARRNSTGTRFLGASQLPGTPENPNPPWRRIDLLLVPACSLGANLIYFTGNDIFNRSIRLLASRKGMRLNQNGLYKNVMRGRGRVKETEGEFVEGRSEKKIFKILGVPWRPPEERRC